MFNRSVILLLLAGVALSIANPTAILKRHQGRLNWGNSRVIGGNTAQPGQFPHQIAMRIGTQHLCGGSIISDRWVLSAAHCTYGLDGFTITIVAGAHRLIGDGDTYEIARRIHYPEYTDGLLHHDISLYQVTTPFQLSDRVAIIGFSSAFIGAGLPAFSSGWGLQEVNHELYST